MSESRNFDDQSGLIQVPDHLRVDPANVAQVVPAGEQTEPIQLPADLQEQQNAQKAADAERDANNAAAREAAGWVTAHAINDTRPAGIAPTLPISVKPRDNVWANELGPSTVRSPRTTT